MDRRRFLQVSGASLAIALRSPSPGLRAQATSSPATRGWLIYVDERLGARGEPYRQRIVSAVSSSPLLATLSVGGPALSLKEDTVLAYNHVIVIALPGDPFLLQAWQREATIAPAALYAFGFGAFQGSVGYVESDRNPFLHAANIAIAPFETQLISITGTDVAGLDSAIDAFLSHGLVNGLVAGNAGWKRASATVLDRDPLPSGFELPAVLPASYAGLGRIAVMQAGEDEYRGVLADTGLEPDWIWRAKYYEPGQWDGAGSVSSIHNYAVGLHRRAYGNTVWVANFGNGASASRAASAIARAAKLSPGGSRWQGNLPAYAWEFAGVSPPGTLELWIDGTCVLMGSHSVKPL